MRWLILSCMFAVSALAAAPGDVVSDFKLLDANPNSVRWNQMVSPRDYRLQISAYFFGNAG